MRKKLLQILVFFLLENKTIYSSKVLSFNGVLLCKNEICYRIAVNGISKFRLFHIEIGENLKIGYLDPNFKKWLYLAFPGSTKSDFLIENDTNIISVVV